MNPYRIDQRKANVIRVYFDEICAGWTQWILLRSDAHHDNVNCDRKLERVHLELAKERSALIFDFGDTFCAMQGKYDPRKSMEELRPEDKVVNYLDAIVNHAADDYKPYAPLWTMLGMGNHEGSILDRHNTNLISRLADKMHSNGSQVVEGGIGGWVQFFFKWNKTKSTHRNLKYHHGWQATDSPVTKGVIQTSRQGVYLPDADIVVNGHNHNAYLIPQERERINLDGTTKLDTVWFIRTPGYKDEYGDGTSGWANTKQKEPKPRGCVWLQFCCDGYGIDTKTYLDIK